jgi:hypothetical protein
MEKFVTHHPSFTYWYKRIEFEPWRCHDDKNKIVAMFERRDGMYLEEERKQQLYREDQASIESDLLAPCMKFIYP